MDKTIRKNPDLEELQNELYRYWASRPVGERLMATYEHSQMLYRAKESVSGARQGSDRRFSRIERIWR